MNFMGKANSSLKTDRIMRVAFMKERLRARAGTFSIMAASTREEYETMMRMGSGLTTIPIRAITIKGSGL